MGFGLPLPVLDGNVARVLSRLHMVDAAIRDPAGAKRLWALAEAMVPRRGAGDWNQALMELGATVCTPRAPACARCPVRVLCRARAAGAVDRYPPVPPRRRPRRVELALAWIERSGRVLVARRTRPPLEGLWEPPGLELAAPADARHTLAARLAALGIGARLAPRPLLLRHALTHRDYRVCVWSAHPAGPCARRRGLRWVDPGAPGVPLTGLARKLAARMRGSGTRPGAPTPQARAPRKRRGLSPSTGRSRTSG